PVAGVRPTRCNASATHHSSGGSCTSVPRQSKSTPCITTTSLALVSRGVPPLSRRDLPMSLAYALVIGQSGRCDQGAVVGLRRHNRQRKMDAHCSVSLPRVAERLGPSHGTARRRLEHRPS